MSSVYDPFGEDLDFPGINDEAREVNPFVEMGANIVLPQLISRLGKTVIGRSLPGLLANVVAGGLWGAGTSIYEGKGLGDIATNTLKGAVEWPMYEAGGKLAGKIWKSRGSGLKNALTQGKQEFWKDMKTELADSLNVGLGPEDSSLRQWAGRRFGATTIGDLIQTGRERLIADPDPLKHSLGMTMFKTGGQEDLITRNVESVFDSLSKNNADLNTRRNVELVLAGSGKKPKFMSPTDYNTALSYLKPLHDTLPAVEKNLDTFAADDFQARLSSEIMSRRPAIIASSTPTASKLFNRLDAIVQTGTSKDVQKELHNIITSGTHPDNIVDLARSYYTMPARTIQATNDAYRVTTLNGLIGKARKEGFIQSSYNIANVPDTYIHVRENPFAGKWKNAIADRIFDTKTGIGDQFVDRDLYRTLYDVADSYRYADKALSRYLMRPWKVTRAVASPQPLIRNLFGNFALNDVTGEHPLSMFKFKDVAHYIQSFKELQTALKGGKSPANDFIDMLGLNRTTFRGEIDMMHKFGDIHGEGNFFDKYLELFYGKEVPWHGVNLNVPGKMIKKMEDFYGKSELFAKYAKYSWNKLHGMNTEKSMVDAVESTFDYGDVSPFVRMLREGPIPFATFQSKMATALPRAILDHPMRVAKYVAVPWLITQTALNNLNMSNSEFEQLKEAMPEYMKQGSYMLMPWRDNKDRLQMFDLSWWLPGLGEFQFGNMTEPKKWISNPWFNVARDLAANQQGLTNAPIYNEWDTGAVKTGKWLNYFYQNLLPIPTWAPPVTAAVPGVGLGDKAIPGASGGVLWKNAIEVMQDQPSAMTPLQWGFSSMGMKTTPVAESELLAKKAAANERLLRDLNSAMKREMTKNPQQSEYILEKYIYLRNNLMREQHRGGY